MKEINKNALLCRAGVEIDTTYILFQGTIAVHTDYSAQKKEFGIQTAVTSPGTRVGIQSLEGSLGKVTGRLVGQIQNNQISVLGMESLLLGIQSPYNCVAETNLVVLQCPSDVLLAELEQMPAKILTQCQKRFSRKLKMQTNISIDLEDNLDKHRKETEDKRIKISKKDDTQQLVEHHFPKSTPTVRHTIQQSYQSRFSKLGKKTGVRGIETEQLNGGITQVDMVRLERLKRNCFLDYRSVDKYLD